jgi:hypothetical protein
MTDGSPKLDLQYLLAVDNILAPGTPVLVMRHRPHEKLRKVFAGLAAERPEIFNAYQETQPPHVEKQLANADYVVSCIGYPQREALFVGLYKVTGQRQVSFDEYLAIPEHEELRRLGDPGWTRDNRPFPIIWTDLALDEALSSLKGKLILDWPPPERSWTRWADRNEFRVKAILKDSILDQGMPGWDGLVLSWAELHKIPIHWVSVLEQWRGIYLIHDVSDGKNYVGSAYGHQNIYGRWINYKDTGDGGNKLLRERKPENFRFSILQRVSPDMDVKDVVLVESSWKDRLHTREFGLNLN